MNRRVFVNLISLSAAAVSLPSLHCNQIKQYNPILHQPSFLSQICDEKTLSEIGFAYRKLKPQEEKSGKLISLLTTETEGEKVSSSDSDEKIEEFLNSKIQSDFKKYETITVKGWVLSLTEARQCALFSHIAL